MLHEQGIHDLANDLVANAAFYDQDTFADRVAEVCGTVSCLAGFCLWRQIGDKRFEAHNFGSSSFTDKCVKAGNKQLGISAWSTPQIFNCIGHWPIDLKWAYEDAKTNKARVKVALLALQRLLPDGSIDPDKKAVHTDLSAQLAQLKSQRRNR